MRFTVSGATDLLHLGYAYHHRTHFDKNNGNVISQTISVPNVGATAGFVAVQSYTDDELNRLKSATENSTPNGGSSSQSWKQTYLFDRFGNRTFDTTSGATTTLPESFDPHVFNPTINPANNQFDSGQDYAYDLAGSIVQDATGKKFVYDGENKQTSFGTGGSTTNGGTYVYDGDGRRVKKIVGTEVTIFVYDAAGHMVAEYATTAPVSPQVNYLTADTLGTPRINTDANGAIIARHDYMPFGEEVSTDVSRAATLGYGGDNIHQKFAQKERDLETQLDYVETRYYCGRLGRFSSPDTLIFSAERPGDPQQFDLYAYVRNSPLIFTDPDGRDGVQATSTDASGAQTALTDPDRMALQKQLRRLAPGTRVSADGKVHKAGFFHRILNHLTGHGAGQALVTSLANSKQTTTIVVTHSGGSGTGGDPYTMSGTATDAVAHWNVNQVAPPGAVVTRTASNADAANGPITSEINMDPAIVLGHELIHANHIVHGTASLDDDATHDFVVSLGGIDTALRESRIGGAPNEEFRTVGFSPYARSGEVTENRLRRELHLPLRVTYYGSSHWARIP